MMQKHTVASWLEEQGMPRVDAGEAYQIGQALTEDEAFQVRRIVNRSYLDSLNFQFLVDWFELSWPSDIPFLKLMTALIDAGAESETNWGLALHDTFTAENHTTLHRLQETE